MAGQRRDSPKRPQLIHRRCRRSPALIRLDDVSGSGSCPDDLGLSLNVNKR